MADPVTFRQALNRCGFVNNATTDGITEQGYDTMLAFARMTNKGVAEFVKTINKIFERATPVVATIPHASIEKLQAMRLWTLERLRMGQNVIHADFTAAEMTRLIARLDEEALLLVNKPEAPPLPEKFTSFGPKWRVFAEGFEGHCAAVRGCMNIPLAYVIREHEVPTQDMYAQQYVKTDDRYIALFLHAGGEFQQDTERVWDLLAPLVRGTAAW
jgi:hypothetical protein